MQESLCGFIGLKKGGACVGKGRYILARFSEDSDLISEQLPGQTIVELAGDRRVLIENHFGVKAYGREQIIVKVKYGYVCVCGCGLELLRMNREQLVIRGRIDEISLRRKEQQ
jgi:sporulation protein YqfC